MAEQTLVSVRGEAVVEVEPELAVIAITVTARDASREQALVRLSERSKALAEILEQFADDLEKTETGGIRLRPEFKEGKPRERVSGYVASILTRATVHDFSHLGELVAQVSSVELADIAGPWWSLRKDSRVHREVRVEAVHDAVRRASEYANALGADLTGLIELADTGLGIAGGEVRAYRATATAARAAAGGGLEAVELDLIPVRQTATAQVEARFTMSAPVLQ